MRVVELWGSGGDPGEVAAIRAVGLEATASCPASTSRWNAKCVDRVSSPQARPRQRRRSKATPRVKVNHTPTSYLSDLTTEELRPNVEDPVPRADPPGRTGRPEARGPRHLASAHAARDLRGARGAHGNGCLRPDLGGPALERPIHARSPVRARAAQGPGEARRRGHV